MKLNNKGLVFSTILYASLALVIVILLMLLAVSKYYKKENTFYKEEIENTLNRCIEQEIELENCYSLGGTCNKTMYHACLGITEDSGVEGLIGAEYLKGINGQNVVSPSTAGLSQDSTDNRRYIYKGLDTAVKNYLEYSSKLFRIVSIEPDGSLKLIYVGSDAPTLIWDDLSGRDWNTSSLKHYLNNEILSSFADISKLKSEKWKSTIVYPSQSLGGLTVAEYNTMTNNQMENFTNNIVGLLTIDDYMKSAIPTNCQNKMLTETGCTSWLSSYSGITMNINGEELSKNNFYYFNGTINQLETSQSRKANYSVVLDRNIVIISGDGTIGNPFKLK